METKKMTAAQKLEEKTLRNQQERRLRDGIREKEAERIQLVGKHAEAVAEGDDKAAVDIQSKVKETRKDITKMEAELAALMEQPEISEEDIREAAVTEAKAMREDIHSLMKKLSEMRSEYLNKIGEIGRAWRSLFSFHAAYGLNAPDAAPEWSELHIPEEDVGKAYGNRPSRALYAPRGR